MARYVTILNSYNRYLKIDLSSGVGGGGGGGGRDSAAATLKLNNFFNICANTMKVQDFFFGNLPRNNLMWSFSVQ